MIHVLIVGEKGLLRGALVAVMSAEDDIKVAELDETSIEQISTLKPQPDVIVIDADITHSEPLRLVRRLGVRMPLARVIVLTDRRTPKALRQALAADVRGFLSKDLAPDELVQMIRQAHAGERVIDPFTALAALSAAANPLSEREQGVLRAAAEGLTAKEIAERLFLTHGTVRNHLSAILRKTGTRNRWQAIRRAQDAGWL